MNVSPPPAVLSFAASDPTGGAGLQADILTIAAQGCHPLSVVTAITVQDTSGVEAVLGLDGEWVRDQARAVLEDMPVAAFKLGMLGSIEAVVAIAEVLADYPNVPRVLDPVLASGRGDQLADDEIIAAMFALLLPQTTLITPNSLEARRLAVDEGKPLDEPDLAECARRLLDAGCEQVLITGTHEPGEEVENVLYGTHGVLRRDRWPRLPGRYHGSGCTLASCIAARLALGEPLSEAVLQAQRYTWQALAAGFRPGMGQFLPARARHGAPCAARAA